MNSYIIQIATDGWTIGFTLCRATVRECYQYIKQTYPADTKVVSIEVNL